MPTQSCDGALEPFTCEIGTLYVFKGNRSTIWLIIGFLPGATREREVRG